MGMFFASCVPDLNKAQATNSTATSFSALIPTLDRPAASATRSVFDLGKRGTRDRNSLVVYPYGGDANNDIVITKVSGWNQTPLGMWVSSMICEVSATLSSTLVGLASREVVATEFFADTLSLTAGVAELYQGTADLDIAYFICSTAGFEIIEITYDLGTGGDRQNALYRFDA